MFATRLVTPATLKIGQSGVALYGGGIEQFPCPAGAIVVDGAVDEVIGALVEPGAEVGIDVEANGGGGAARESPSAGRHRSPCPPCWHGQTVK